MIEKIKKARFKTPNPKEFIVQATDVSSGEMYRYTDEREEPVLKKITLDLRIGECLGVIDDEPFELEMLMQIIGNVRPYESGRCSLTERGMMRRKRRILPHVFYITGGDTVPGNLNTLEYLMYITARSRVADRKRQISILQALLDSELHALTLVPMKLLTAAERATICLLSAAMSKALLVVFSVAEMSFTPQLIKGIKHIVEMVQKRGGAVLIGTSDCELVQGVCTHGAFMVHGEMIRNNTIDVLLNTLDQRAFIITTNKPKELSEAIDKASESLQTYIFDQEVHVYVRDGGTLEQDDLLKILIDANVSLETIQASRRTLRNAYREVVLGHVV